MLDILGGQVDARSKSFISIFSCRVYFFLCVSVVLLFCFFLSLWATVNTAGGPKLLYFLSGGGVLHLQASPQRKHQLCLCTDPLLVCFPFCGVELQTQGRMWVDFQQQRQQQRRRFGNSGQTHNKKWPVSVFIHWLKDSWVSPENVMSLSGFMPQNLNIDLWMKTFR